MGAVEEYQDSFAAYQKVELRLKQIAKVVRDTSALLDLQQGWRLIVVDGVNVSCSDQAALSPRGRAIDGRVWPTATEIAESLLAYDQAIKACQSAFERVPVERRAGLEQPPKF